MTPSGLAWDAVYFAGYAAALVLAAMVCAAVVGLAGDRAARRDKDLRGKD